MAKRKKQEFKRDERNTNVHNDRSNDAVKNSLASLGAGRSILVDSENTLIAGECTHEQAKALGLPLTVVETDGSTLVVVKRTDLKTDDPRRRALAIADNRTASLSELDYAALSSELKTLEVEFESYEIELSVTGFADFELEPLLSDSYSFVEPEKTEPTSTAIGDAGSAFADNSSAGLQSDGRAIFFGQDQYEIVDRIIAYARDQQGDEASDSECIVWALLRVLEGSSF